MGAFLETVGLERALLHLLTTSRVLARMQSPRVKEEWFTSTARKFIFRTAKSVMADSKSLLTKKVFEFELGGKVSVKDEDIYVAEWNLVEGTDALEGPEVLIDKLTEAAVAGR